MYNIIQLNDKNLSELQSIAQELGIKKTDSLKKEELVYKILDEQAIAGATKKVAAEKLKEAGARRCMMLNVDGAFHSPFLKQAGEELKEALDTVEIHALQLPYVTNVTAEYVTDKESIVPLLCQQISSPVRFMQSLERMLDDGVDQFVEIGPGRTLAGFLKKTDRQAKVWNVQNFADVQRVKEELYV